VKTNFNGNGNLKFPSWVNRGLDTDIVVPEVRETSREPDEVYGLIDRPNVPQWARSKNFC